MTIAGIEMSSITVEFNGKDFARIAKKIFPECKDLPDVCHTMKL